MRRIRAIVADDETFSREYLRRLLAACADVEVVAVCSDGRGVADAIRELRPDVAFLDIRMPLLSGTEVLDGIDGALRPLVVFCTAHDQYALHAFDYAAADYLLKPFDAARLQRALGRVRARLTPATATEAAPAQATPVFLRRIVVRHDECLRIVPIEDLHWVEADGKLLILHTCTGPYRLRKPMRELEAELDPAQFARIHRATIIAMQRIRELHPLPDGDYGVVMEDGRALTLSRTYRDVFFARMRG